MTLESHANLFENQFKLILPEIFLFTAIHGIILYGTCYSTSFRLGYPILTQQVTWLGIWSLAITGALLAQSSQVGAGLVGSQLFLVDAGTQDLKILTVLFSRLVLLLSRDYLKVEKVHSFEYSILILLAVGGNLFLLSSVDLLSFYLSLELGSLCLYVLAAYRRNSDFSTEAGLKYFTLGAFSSGVLLFGCSLLYGFTGLTQFGDLALLFAGTGQTASHALASSQGIGVGACFVGVALLFKLSAAPFHMWSPDVYEGAPTSVTAFFALVPKIAILTMLLRLFYLPFYDWFPLWQGMMVACALASLVVGCFGALYQRKIKRLLAYSSIGHVGFLLMGVASGSVEGVQACFFYLGVYLVMMTLLFGFLLSVRRAGSGLGNAGGTAGARGIQISDWKGLGRSNPLLSITVALGLFSMAGIPPLAGFYSKMYLFFAALEAQRVRLAVLAVFTSVVSSFYYVRILKILYFEKVARWDLYRPISREGSLCLGVSLGFLVAFVFVPAPFLLLAQKSALLLCL
jgi:NADH-quinone oxidoreductase subunit N